MSRFGRYEVVEELYRTALATVSRARGNAVGDAKFVVKTFTPPEFGVVDESAERAFLEQAELQKRVAEQKGSRHWAAVHDVGKQADAAYYVSDYYPLTAQRLITGRMTLTPAALYRLVSSVVRGLRELKGVADRAHGNLKPSNILIAGQGGDAAAAAGVVLADPAPASRLSSWGEQSDDLTALGHLIHQLVLHRPFRSPGGWPIEASPEWTRLGRFGEGWRTLCNRLLDPTGQQRPADLAEVSRLVARLGSNRKRRLTQLAIVLVALAALVGGAGAVGYQLDHRNRSTVTAAHAGWLGELHRRVRDEPKTIETYRADPTLAALLDADSAARERGVSFDLPATLPRDKTALDAFRRARESAAAVHDLESRIAADGWPLLKEATARAETFRNRKWDQSEKTLTAAIDPLRSAGGTRDASFWNSVDALLALKPHALSSNTDAEREWLKLEKSLAAPIKKDSDAARVRDAMAARARGAAHLSPTGLAGAKEFAACAAAVDAWAALDAAGYDAAALSKKLADAKLTISPAADPAALAAFVKGVGPEVKVVGVEAMPDLKAALDSFEKTKAFADKDPKSADVKQRYDQAKSAVAARVAAFNAAGGTPADAKALREAIEQFAKDWSSPSDPTAWLRTATAPPAVSSEALKDAWTRWLAAAGLAGSNVVDASVTPEKRKQTDDLRAALLAVDQRFPRPDAATLPAPFAKEAGDRREEELAQLVREPLRPGSPLPAPLLDANAAKPYQQWLANLTELAKDFPLKDGLLPDPLPRPDEAWAKRDPAFWQDARVQNLVRRDVNRLKTLAAVRVETDRASLASYATDEGVKPEVALAAWRRLGTVNPPWPANAAELDVEAKVRGALANTAAGLPAADRTTIERELTAQGPTRWYRLVNAAGPDSAADLDRAAGVAKSFGVALDASTGALPADASVTPAARFNFLLRAARAAAAAKEATDADAARLAASLRGSVPAELKTKLAPLVNDLSKLDRKPFFPAAAKQAGEGRMTLAVGALPKPLEFVRVQGDGVAPFYLCTTEVSVAIFLAAGGNDAKSFLPDPPLGDGPFTWSWTDGAVKPGVGQFGYWLPEGTPANKIGFAESLRQQKLNRFVLADAAGGAPSADHPIQKIAPDAALAVAGALGCRLPSSAEWSAALATAKDVTDWNLRDTTWRTQQAYVANPPGGFAGVWPDAGIFVPAGASVARGAQARTHSSTDNVLFFRPVGPDAGRTFSHLVGNVAEFTFDAPEAFEDLPDKSPAKVAALLKSKPTSLTVIGGSALSPPEVPTDKPQPVGDLAATYSDVGFRLAFPEPAGSPLGRLRAVLAEQKYLAPKAE